MEHEELGVIVKKICDGHPEAFDELYLATYKAVYFHAKSILKDNEEALDAVQDAYLAAFQGLGQLREPAAVKQWLCKTVSNICFNKLRKTKHGTNLSLDDDTIFLEPPAAAEEMPEQVLDRNSTHQIVSEMIEKLPHLQQLTVLLYYYDEMSVAQIATEMECSENTVKSRLSYARKNLETQVLAEEKRGIKLYGFTPAAILPALEYMVRHNTISEAAAASLGAALAKQCGYAALLSTGISAASSAAAATAGAASTAGVASTAATGTAAGTVTAGTAAAAGAGATGAGIGISAKIAAALLAGIVVIGGAGIAALSQNQEVTAPLPETTLAATMPAETPETVAQSEPTTEETLETEAVIDLNMRLTAFTSFAESVVQEDFNRFMLYDCNGDGREELLAIYTNDYMYIYAEIYDTDDNGELICLFSPEPEANAGAPVLHFVSLQYHNQPYLAYYYANADGEGSFGTFYLLQEAGQGLETVHTITFRTSGQSASGQYLIDGVALSTDEFAVIKDSIRILAEFWDADDEGMSPMEFIETYQITEPLEESQ